ncbi:hypothetical protein LX36DRAFT_664383 [Colletotrichum falcatum]|nr:hypothetical protein LX36DRAFT_664383 [Colletotrichum falcatum]
MPTQASVEPGRTGLPLPLRHTKHTRWSALPASSNDKEGRDTSHHHHYHHQRQPPLPPTTTLDVPFRVYLDQAARACSSPWLR